MHVVVRHETVNNARVGEKSISCVAAHMSAKCELLRALKEEAVQAVGASAARFRATRERAMHTGGSTYGAPPHLIICVKECVDLADGREARGLPLELPAFGPRW